VVSHRFDQMQSGIDRSGAMQSAMAVATASAAGVHKTNRMAFGAGYQNGHSALSASYQHAIGESATLTLSGAFTDGDSTAAVGYGFGW
jgi:hypothetical protein